MFWGVYGLVEEIGLLINILEYNKRSSLRGLGMEDIFLFSGRG